MKRFLVVIAVVVIVAMPFVLRPKQEVRAQADETVVVITPHNEAIRFEYARGFGEWYRQKTGRSVAIEWRMVGGTSEIARFLEGEYVSAFQYWWTRKLGRSWSSEIQAGFQSDKYAAKAAPEVREAREAFMKSDVGCGIDVFFGGGTYDFEKQAQAGRLVDAGLVKARPEWFKDGVIPRYFGGEEYWHADGLWIGAVLSSYGIVFNRDALQRLGITHEPNSWRDLADPRLRGEVGLADPTKSGSVAKAFENIIQQQMQRRLRMLPAGASSEEVAVWEGWRDGLRLIQLIGANSRYFTDSSQKPPIDVAAGNCAAGLCIDFYGRQQQEAVVRRDQSNRIGYITPVGGSVNSVDPIGLLRGARNRAAAVLFIEYVMSLEGQKLWNFKVGTPGGPERFVLRRTPVRRDFHERADWQQYRSDPEDNPYDDPDPLIYRSKWTGDVFREMALVIRIMCQDAHAELTSAWRAINEAPEPLRTQALAVLQDMSAVEYDRVRDEVRRAITSRNKVEEVHLSRKLADFFRKNYIRAGEIARGG